MQNVNITEQWNLDGICKNCRRSAYCSKPCKRHKEHMRNFVRNTFKFIMPGVFSKVDDNYFDQLL